jgi:hypothetical protein
MPRPRFKPWPPDPNQTASGKPGAVHLDAARFDGPGILLAGGRLTRLMARLLWSSTLRLQLAWSALTCASLFCSAASL